MGKLIIDNRTDLSDSTCLTLVKIVTDKGRISNNGKQYCYGSVIKVSDGKVDKNYMVSTDLNKKSDRFIIMETKQVNHGSNVPDSPFG